MSKWLSSDDYEDAEEDATRSISPDKKFGGSAGHRPKQKSAENIIFKILNRERSSFFNFPNLKSHSDPYKEVPSALSFCLKDIVPICYLESHIFMGLTSCGQFLISYKRFYENEDASYDFSSVYKYEIYFWIYSPGKLLSKYYSVRLFDDHSVNDIKVVTMTQWKSDLRTLIIHGASDIDDTESFVSIIRIPKLACLECKTLRDNDFLDGDSRSTVLCIQCCLTIHTKYHFNENTQKFNPNVNLNCPNFIIMSENSFIHTLNLCLDVKKPNGSDLGSNVINSKYLRKAEDSNSEQNNIVVSKDCITTCNHKFNINQANSDKFIIDMGVPATNNHLNYSNFNNILSTNINNDCDKNRKMSIVDEILADFSEYDIEYSYQQRIATTQAYLASCGSAQNSNAALPSTSKSDVQQNSIPNAPKHVYFSNVDSNSQFSTGNENIEELIITCDTESAGTASKISQNSKIVAFGKKSILKTPEKTPENCKLTQKLEQYEFCEENEKCEKISTFRKRRLADKKYEFSEDNSENIIPFNRMRRCKSDWPIYKCPPAVGHYSCTMYELQSPHSHRASPNHGFRSPCGSPVSHHRYENFLRSPPGFRSPSYRSPSTASPSTTYANRPMLSPQKTSLMRNNFMGSPVFPGYPGSSSSHADEGHKYFSDIINRIRDIRANNGNNEFHHDNIPDSELKPDLTTSTGKNNDKPLCSKKIIKHYVEEDDATSVRTTCTNEEDDCISPGYHTSLPMEVHGGYYSNMQIVSKNSISKLNCPTVVITQNSFDIEAFTIYVANYLCSTNNKKYGILYDSAYEILYACPQSYNVNCILLLQFTASDIDRIKQCQNCSNTSDCLIHRKLYQSTILFTWNINSGEWEVIDYGKVKLVTNRSKKGNGRSQNLLVKKLNKLTKSNFHPDVAGKVKNKKFKGKLKKMKFNLHNDNEYLHHLRILDSNEDKTKESLIDLQNCIEFFRKHPYDTPSDCSSISSTSSSEDSVLSMSSDDDFDESTDDPNRSSESTGNAAGRSFNKALLLA